MSDRHRPARGVHPKEQIAADDSNEVIEGVFKFAVPQDQFTAPGDVAGMKLGAGAPEEIEKLGLLDESAKDSVYPKEHILAPRDEPDAMKEILLDKLDDVDDQKLDGLDLDGKSEVIEGVFKFAVPQDDFTAPGDVAGMKVFPKVTVPDELPGKVFPKVTVPDESPGKVFPKVTLADDMTEAGTMKEVLLDRLDDVDDQMLDDLDLDDKSEVIEGVFKFAVPIDEPDHEMALADAVVELSPEADFPAAPDAGYEEIAFVVDSEAPVDFGDGDQGDGFMVEIDGVSAGSLMEDEGIFGLDGE